jgi:hypothetical protein
MRDFELRELDSHSVAVEVVFPDRRCVLKGRGHFELRGEFGPCLRVNIADPTGDFEILLKQNQWSGQILTGEKFSCDFAVQLDANCLCTH